jgi:CelD/BcsL family acetyltransferase involved in cellulose biosynthesis
LAKAKIEPSGTVLVETSCGPVSLCVTDDFKGLEPLWEELQRTVRCTATHTYAWARAWAHAMGSGPRAAIAVGYGADGKLLFLWPFEMAPTCSLTVLSWLGQEHAAEAAVNFAAADVARLLDAVARRTGAVAAILRSQPFSWDGVANPFAGLPHQSSPSVGYAVRLGDYEALFEARFGKRSRGNFLRKERRLAEAGVLTYGWAETRDERKVRLTRKFGGVMSTGDGAIDYPVQPGDTIYLLERFF